MLQLFTNGSGDGFFQSQRVRAPLVMNAWSRKCFCWRTAEIHDPNDGEHHLRDDGGPPSGPKNEHGPGVLTNDRRTHAGKRAFARPYRIGVRADKAEAVWHAWEREIIH